MFVIRQSLFSTLLSAPICSIFTDGIVNRYFSLQRELAYSLYDNKAEKSVLLLHGIMGNRRNWGNFVKQLNSQHKNRNYITVDLPSHGDSFPCNGTVTLRDIALNVYETILHCGCPVDTIIGHSFGGKIALELMTLHREGLPLLPSTAIILDISIVFIKSFSHRSIEDEESMNSINKVVAAVDSVQRPITSYSYLKEQLMKAGLTPALADWLSTSVRRNDSNTFEFVFQTDTIRAMLQTYRQKDYWDIIGNPPQECMLRLVRAERNALWTEDIIERLEILEEDLPNKISTRLVKNSGHWMQVDNPRGLYDAICDLL